jgi:hypothetical protein
MQMVAAHSEFLVSQGSSNTGSTSAEQYHQVTATLQQHDKPGDCWLFVRCGRWLGSEPGLASAALAVLQVWHVAEGKGDYRLWQLDDRCMLTGEEYFSLTGAGCDITYNCTATLSLQKQADKCLAGQHTAQLACTVVRKPVYCTRGLLSFGQLVVPCSAHPCDPSLHSTATRYMASCCHQSTQFK